MSLVRYQTIDFKRPKIDQSPKDEEAALSDSDQEVTDDMNEAIDEEDAGTAHNYDGYKSGEENDADEDAACGKDEERKQIESEDSDEAAFQNQAPVDK